MGGLHLGTLDLSGRKSGANPYGFGCCLPPATPPLPRKLGAGRTAGHDDLVVCREMAQTSVFAAENSNRRITDTFTIELSVPTNRK